jgi:hypothetical protein
MQEVVWTGACDYKNNIVQDFLLQPYPDKEGHALTAIVHGADFLSDGGTAGVFLGEDYEIKHATKAEEFHEFLMVDGGKRVIANMGGRMRLPWQGFRDDMTNDLQIERTGFREMDPHTRKVFFEWFTHEYVGFDESTLGRPKKGGSYWEPL